MTKKCTRKVCCKCSAVLCSLVAPQGIAAMRPRWICPVTPEFLLQLLLPSTYRIATASDVSRVMSPVRSYRTLVGAPERSKSWPYLLLSLCQKLSSSVICRLSSTLPILAATLPLFRCWMAPWTFKTPAAGCECGVLPLRRPLSHYRTSWIVC